MFIVEILELWFMDGYGRLIIDVSSEDCVVD